MVFVIARKNRTFLDTPVFHAGLNSNEEAVAIFSERRLAEQYIWDAQWAENYEVGELQPIELARWLVLASEDGTDMLVIDPVRNDHLQGEHQDVIFLSEPLDAFAEALSKMVRARELMTLSG